MKSAHKTLDRIDAAIDPRSFFKKYVATRTPVIIKGLLNDSTFKANRWADLNYLSTKAGDVEVMVEPIHLESHQFGTDIERITMPFHEFIDSLRKDEGQNHYLTTQYAADEETEDGETSFVTYSPPTNLLKDEFPSTPALTGNLVLQQVNLWIGKSKDGTSSGLHHDFHDNLYCLLLGHKRFVLFPPQEAPNLYPHGEIETVHPNGLISYTHNILRPDCLSAKQAAHIRVQALEKKMEKSKGKARAKLEKLHNNALEAMMDFLVDDEDGNDDFADIDLGIDGEDEANNEEEEDEEDDGNEHGDSESTSSKGKGNQLKTKDNEEPSSFSHIPTAVLHKHLNLPTTAVIPPSPTSYDLIKPTTAYVAYLNPGEMLYLPASWWHEVTSSGGSSKDHIHMAFNYWFYPPDGLKRFEEPYEDDIVWGYLRSQLKASEKQSEKRKRDGAGGSTAGSKRLKQ